MRFRCVVRGTWLRRCWWEPRRSIVGRRSARPSESWQRRASCGVGRRCGSGTTAAPGDGAGSGERGAVKRRSCSWVIPRRRAADSSRRAWSRARAAARRGSGGPRGTGPRAGRRGAWLALVLRRLGLSPRAGTGAAALLLFGYLWLLAFPAPATRAVVMLVTSEVARLRQRVVAPRGVIALSGVVLLLADPWALHSVGAWLSVTAIGAVI